MARFGDVGPYDMGNVEITTNVENATAGSTGQVKSPEARAKISAGNKGKHNREKSEAEKAHLSVVLKGRPSKRKGRIFSGMHILSKGDVLKLRKMKAQGVGWDRLKSYFGVGRSTVWRAINDQNYGFEDGEEE